MMVAVIEPDIEEKYLIALLEDFSGLDIAEFCWVDAESEDGCWRAWDFQWAWYRNRKPLQIDQCGRAVGKTNGIEMRGFAFPFNYPGQEMLITAPELNHLRPIVDKIESRLMSRRFSREMLPISGKSTGFSRQPQWQVRFTNDSRILSRLPNRDGKGVKGIHSTVIELDEGQDYPRAGWAEIIESRNSWADKSYFRVHGVSKGVRDKYFEMTQPGSGFFVHRWMGMHRPSWNDEERAVRVAQYGKSRQAPDYRRNVYGEHGDATNPLFVLARLTACIDLEAGSEYNQDIYQLKEISYEQIKSNEQPDNPEILQFLHFPGTHINPNVLAPKGYGAYYGGMDVGLTNHPSEIMILGHRLGQGDHLDLITRIQLRRIKSEDQKAVVRWLFNFYGQKLRAFGIDRGGLGFPIVQDLQADRVIGSRIYGWNFDEKVVTGFEDRELERDETMEDLAIYRPFVEHSSDVLRNDYIDLKRITLPNDGDLINQFQGQTYTIVKGTGPYGKRSYSEGQFHALDGVRLAIGAKVIPPLEARLNEQPDQEAVLDLFMV